MSLAKGALVYSVAGRDKGLYIVVSEQDGYVHIANGKQYRIEAPKRKNIKHLVLCTGEPREDYLASDKLLKRTLAAISGNSSVRRVEACPKKT
ncbi:MAG: KOW domain-containing RNA-binding protein [Oscillospiraceae bacterium]